MRISDWSSDVCSSDLRGVRADDRHDLGVDVLRIAEIDVAPCAASAPAVCTGNGRFQGRYRLPRPDVVEDRKSVVWGKRVSVRVDLGGRRTIKKKKIENEREE